MNLDEEFVANGSSIKSSDLGANQWLLTIARCEAKMFTERDGTSKKKLLIHFHELEKVFFCNATNREEIALYYGRNTDLWIGRQVILFVAQGVKQMDGSRGTGLRVRIPPEAQMKAQPQAAPPTPPRDHMQAYNQQPPTRPAPPSHTVTPPASPPAPNGGPASPYVMRDGDTIPF